MIRLIPDFEICPCHVSDPSGCSMTTITFSLFWLGLVFEITLGTECRGN